MRALFVALLLGFAIPTVAVVGGGDVRFKVKGASEAVFSHDAHVVKANLGCRECHPKLYLDTARSKRVTMAQMKKGQSCGACHDGKRAVGLDACNTCHR